MTQDSPTKILLADLDTILRTLVMNGVQVELTTFDLTPYGTPEPCLAFKVHGFYKSDTVTLVPKEFVSEDRDHSGALYVAFDRYNMMETIYSISDLVGLNAHWWQKTIERNPGTTIGPDPQWAKLLEEHGYIRTRTVKVVEPNF
jgi:hypothetical protein